VQMVLWKWASHRAKPGSGGHSSLSNGGPTKDLSSLKGHEQGADQRRD
jgi:hypothetical protein